MIKRPIYFQYLRGENQGKIVELEKIDDSGTLNEYLYYFNDGTKYFESFVGLWGDVKAYTSNKILAMIPNINTLWRFEVKEVKQQHKKSIGEDGKEYEIPDPYFIDRNTGKALHNTQSIKVSDKAYPPPYRRFEPIEISNEYYMSYSSEDKEETILDEKVQIKENNKEPEDSNWRVSPNILEKTSHQDMPITMNLDLKDDQFMGPVVSIIKDKEIFAGPDKLWNILNDLVNEILTDPSVEYPIKENNEFNISDPIKILVDSCKKNPQNITMDINIDLPNKSFYKMVYENYGEEMANQAIYYLIDNLDISVIKHALKESLIEAYSQDAVAVNN
jgi:hypothetical protein